MEFIKLFEPITINGLEIKNRIVMPAMGLSYTSDYTFNDRYRGFYRTRAKGGVGLMFIGPVAIDQVGSAPLMPGLFDDRNDEALSGFLAELHQTTTAKVATQLFHMGRYAYSFLTGHTPIAPSPIPSKLTRETPREMTLEDIEQVQESFVRAALKARNLGFDYIEVIACTGYLISQFLSPVTNHRTDQYGGTPENRMRFGLEVIQKVRAALGPDVPLGIRIAGHDFMEGGNTNREAAQFAAAAEQAGVNAVNVTGGWHETNVPQLTTNVPKGMYLYLARGVKNKVSVPVFASNRLGDPELAEKALRTGSADMICWGRPLITDPELPNKIQAGRLDQTVFCIACNQGCFDSIFSGTAVHCILNPLAGRENEFTLGQTASPKNILVAGGGPAGMEFALTAAAKGHRVTLFEKENRLGGQINLALVPPGKEELGGIVSSLESRMAQAGVAVELGSALNADRVRELKPDLLVAATGARPITLQVPGVDRPHVYDAWDVLQDKVPQIGSKVVIVGGSATGCETAHYISSLSAADPAVYAFLMYHNAEDSGTALDMLHNPGRDITIIDVVDRMAANVGRTQRWSLMKSLRLMGVRLLTGTGLKEITESEVIVEVGGRREAIPADTVIMAVGARPWDELSREVQQYGIKTITIGDAKKTRCITDAIREGFEEALKV